MEEQKILLKNVDDIRKALATLNESAFDAKELPEEIVDRIGKMCNEARYMSPSDNPEALEIEHQIISLAEAIESAFCEYSMNEASIQQKLAKCERLLANRKQIHSK